MRKVFSVFQRDIKIALKDPMIIWIGIAPIILAIVVALISPGVNDSMLNLAVDKSIDKEYTDKIENYANVEFYDNVKDIERRVLRRDEVIGVVKQGDGVELIAQGNESENGLKLAKILNSLYELDGLVTAETGSRLSFLTFNQKIPPLKLALSVSILLLATIISSMVIALGLVDEKTDRTIKAANVTPIKQTVYVFSKSLIGILTLIFSSIVSLLVLGMININWFQMILMILVSGILSIILAFVIGLSSSDFIEAAGSLKALMMPMIASILVYELCSEKYHWTVWWSPFYWSNKAMNEIINNTATWSNIGIYCIIIIAICSIVFLISKKFIRKALQ